MRGLALMLMLFVNDLDPEAVPSWLSHTRSGSFMIGLADWIFPGFLFLVGISIPFSFSKRISGGSTMADNTKRILSRTISFLVIGILMLNVERVDGELTGINRNLWASLMYIAVFLIWNNYLNKQEKPFTVTGFRLAGIGILIILVFKFRSGLPENEGSLISGWWGILGLIGWGYMVSAFTFILCRNSIPYVIVVMAFFLGLNILSGSQLLEFTNPVKPLLGVILEGSVPFMCLIGLLAGLIVKKSSANGHRAVIQNSIIAGILCLLTGFALQWWFVLLNFQATASRILICCSISFFVFIMIYLLTDVFKKEKLLSLLKTTGENTLTAYLAAELVYFLIMITNLPVMSYKQSSNPLFVFGGSLVWVVLIIYLSAFLKKTGISLKI
jgi:predicted acyltransferase